MIPMRSTRGTETEQLAEEEGYIPKKVKRKNHHKHKQEQFHSSSLLITTVPIRSVVLGLTGSDLCCSWLGGCHPFYGRALFLKDSSYRSSSACSCSHDGWLTPWFPCAIANAAPEVEVRARLLEGPTADAYST
jgi:hypothetical protein